MIHIKCYCVRLFHIESHRMWCFSLAFFAISWRNQVAIPILLLSVPWGLPMLLINNRLQCFVRTCRSQVDCMWATCISKIIISTEFRVECTTMSIAMVKLVLEICCRFFISFLFFSHELILNSCRALYSWDFKRKLCRYSSSWAKMKDYSDEIRPNAPMKFSERAL